jgi:DNA-binding GntR family transcriptional regulator
VREALALLEYENFIGPRGGRGLYVRAVTQSEFIEMFIANEAVEPDLARRAALLATQQQLDDMKGAFVRAQQCAVHFEMAGFLRSSRDFHRLLGEAADNRPLAQFVVRNEERTDMYLLNYGKVVEHLHMEESNNEHRAILDAVQARDPEAAGRLVIYHAQSLRKRFAELFSEEAME